MHNVLQQSTCRHGRRRKVAKRALNALGGVSGLCGPLNGDKQISELKAALEFADSLEQYKSKEKQRKVAAAMNKKKKQDDLRKARAERAEKARDKRMQFIASARAKLGLGPDDQFARHHVRHLNANQLKVCEYVSAHASIHAHTIPSMRVLQAVAFSQCGEVVLRGKVDNMRSKLSDLLPVGNDPVDGDSASASAPAYATQDDVYEECSDQDDESSERVVVTVNIDDMRVGEIVEVFWEGENQWYEGEIVDVCLEDNTFQILYRVDSQCIWHSTHDYPVRMSC